MHIVDAEDIGHHFGAATVVTGQQMAADLSRMQGSDRLLGTGLEAVAESEQAKHSGLRAQLDEP
ncbi:hypothetical protein D3C75_1129800 [compost metagenome]